MAAYGWYILKVSMCIVVFYTFYVLILRNYTFFLLNRLYLVLCLMLSFVIPLLNFPVFKSQSENALLHIIYPYLIEPEYEFFHPQNLQEHVTSINYPMVLSIIYFMGISILLVKFLFSIIRIIRIRNHSETYQLGWKKIIRMKLNSPFSFFHMIFLPQNENDPMIIAHEMAHVRQFHCLDLILIEIVSMLLWFNPFIFLYKKSLKLQHEYLADTSVVKDTNQIEQYLTCMLKQIQTVSYNGIISQFYCKTIKKRIIMITKNKTSNKYLGIYLFVLPIVCLMLFSFSADKPEMVQANEAVEEIFIQSFIYPVDIKKIKGVSGYGERINGKTKKKHFHTGIDIAISEGEEVMATANGVVMEAKLDSKKGNYIVINHDEVFSTLYSHLQSISVQVGDKLEKGQVIGYSGNTGYSTGPHLHYEIIKNGQHVNPADYLPQYIQR